jgi:osmoprotectant transport system substrate-binding protein
MRKIFLPILTIVLTVLVTSCAVQQAPPAAEQPSEAEAPTAAPETVTEAVEEKEAAPKGPIVVGSKNFTEQYILGWMTILGLEDAGFETESQIDLGGTTANREALENGEIDLYWEYTGTAWLVHLGHEEPITDPQTAYQEVKAEDEENGLVWLDYAPFNNTYTLMMRQQAREELGITKISDLKQYVADNPDAVVCIDQEFAVRPDGLPALQEDYGLDIKQENVIPMEIGVTYKALRDGECDIAMGFATDGRIAAWSFYNLEDDQNFFPVYNPAPVVREEVIAQYPEIADILNPIAQSLDTETMTRLNSLVDVGPDEELDSGDEMEPRDVARQYLQEQGFIASTSQ